MSLFLSARSQRLYYVALTCHLSLFAWVIAWQAYFFPHPHFNPVYLTVLWAMPLLLPLKGMLKAQAYTFAWANFVLMLYVLHALTLLLTSEQEAKLAIVELLLSLASFLANAYYARLRGKELGLALPRLSVVEKKERERYQDSND